MPKEPMKITLYDPETDEELNSYSRAFVPWGILKGAVQLQKSLDPDNMTEEDVEALAALVAEAFGNKFSAQNLMDGSDVGEMLTILQVIITRANAVDPNPTAKQVMKITLYDSETDQELSSYSRAFVPWGILKGAVQMQKSLDPDNMTEEDVEALAALVAEAFGNKFSAQILVDGSDVGEMLTVLQVIIARANGANLNPTPPGK